MKNLKFLLVAAAAAASAILSMPAAAQNASLDLSGSSQATCTYTGLTVVNGNLNVTCSTAVNYTGGGPSGGGSGPFSLTAVASPLGSGTFVSNAAGGWTCTSASCTATIGANGFPASTGSVQITASPATGSTFVAWGAGPCSGQGATCSIALSSITSNTTLTATFTTSVGCGAGGCGTVPVGCTGLTPTTNYEARASLGGQGQSSVHYGKAGVTYSYPLPVGQGLISTTGHPLTPPGINMEIGISQCPGDLTYYTTPASKYTKFGSLQVPCGGIYIPESGGVKWGATTPSWDAYCIVTGYASTNTWYFNVRYNTGCDGGANCPIVYFWNQQ